MSSTPRQQSASAGGIIYTCDHTVTAISATACDTLNSTISGLYSSIFTNIVANIYVKMGNTPLGQSDSLTSQWEYSQFRNALVANQSDSNDATAIANSVPVTSPFGSRQVNLTFPLSRALGLFTPLCAPSSGCYDGTITLSNSQPFFFRTGTIAPNQFDFFTVVEHETDEILGSPSCAFGCPANEVNPTDLFRYSSNGARSFAAGSNSPCTASDSTNACFSLDATHMLQQFNNVDNGEDAGDWVPNCQNQLVQNAALCPGIAGVDISPAAEIPLLDVIGYTAGSVSGPAMVTSVSSSTPNGVYGTGSTLAIQINFNESVSVSGFPQLALNSGGTAFYASGSGTSSLTFAYTIDASDFSNALDYTSTTALSGGTFQVPGGASVSLTLPAPGSPGSLGANSSLRINPPVPITIQTSPAGLQFSVDGNAIQTAPATVNLPPGSHSISVAAIQPGTLGTRYAFSGWSDGTSAPTDSIIVGASAATYTANFQAQVQLTLSVSPAGTGAVTPAGGGFYPPGTVVTITAAPNTGYAFSNWSGAVASAGSASTTITIATAGPVAATANFTPVPGITIQTSPPGLQFSINSGAPQTAPQSIDLTPGSYTLAVAQNQTLSGASYVFAGWSDGLTASHKITVTSAPGIYTATFASLAAAVGGGLSVPPVTSLSANGYFTVFGTNLTSAPPRLLQPSDLVNGALPTNLGSTCVNAGSARAFPTFVASGQINAIAPPMPASGPVQVSVTLNCGTANEVTTPVLTLPANAASPEFLYWVQNANGQDAVIAVDAVHGDYIGPPGLISGLTFRPARPGEVLTIYGIGFGATASGGPVPGTLPPAADNIPNASVMIGVAPTPALYAGVTPGSAGLYQVNLTVPSHLTPGNYAIVLLVNGAATPSGAFLAVGQ